jgi:hypothetical protein
MNWGEMALRLVVRGRDRETISGDLLEEYREEILPSEARSVRGSGTRGR